MLEKNVLSSCPIPQQFQHFTTYVAAIGGANADQAAARALIEQLQGAPARRFAAEHGMLAPQD